MVHLFLRTLEVMSAALAEHHNDAVYDGLRRANERRAQGRRVGVRLYDDEMGEEPEQCTFTYRDGQFELLAHGESGPEPVWRVGCAYLRRVVEDPRRYIDRPELLDWTWLQVPT